MGKRRRAAWYGVRAGRSGPSVYKTWEECAEHVLGYPRAVFKGFASKREALAFAFGAGSRHHHAGTRASASPRLFQARLSPAVWLDVYTDGSHLEDGTMGYGIYAWHRGRDYGLSQRVDAAFLDEFFGLPPDMTRNVSSPTMELCAVCHLLFMLATYTRAGPLQVVRIHSDYDGPRNWIEGRWQARKPYIQHLVECARRHLELAREKGIIVEFMHVDAHSGDVGNDRADRLAKGYVPSHLLCIHLLLDQ